MEALEPIISLEIVSQYTKFCVWLSRMESVATSNTVLKNVDKKRTGLSAVQETVEKRISMFCEGFNIIIRLYKLLYLCLMIHINEEKAISKGLLGKLVLAIETVKASAYILRKKAEAFDTMILSKTIAKSISSLLRQNVEKVRGERSKDHLHKVVIFYEIVQLLDTSLSELKITWIRHALGFLTDWIFSEDSMRQIRNLLRKL